MVEKYSKIILGLILLASLVLRTYGLQTSPPSLYWDEMDVGYQAYSILKTGKDYFGETPLLTIHSFADFRAPLSIYLTIPFVWIMGLSAWSVRLPSAIMGVISVLLVYILSEIFFKNKKLSLLAALLVAVAPWNIQYSRIAFEATLMLMLSLFLGGLICFFKGLERPRWFVLSALLFSLSLFAYNTAKLFVPLVIVLLIAIYIRKKALTKIAWISLGIFAIGYLLSLYGTVFLGGGQRFSEVSVFTDPQISSQVDFLRHDSAVAYSKTNEVGQLARISDKIIYSKPTFILDKLGENYLQVFSTDFLFISGDPNLRHSTGTGEFYRIEFLTIILGFVFLIINFKKGDKTSLFLILWIITAPLASVVTRDGGNHATRLFFLFPVLALTSAYGFIKLWDLLPNKISLLLISSIFAVLIFNIASFLNIYFGTYKLKSAESFQYGFDQAVTKALEKKDQYEYVIIDDRRDTVLMNYLFLTKYDPALFQSQMKTMGNSFIDSQADIIGNNILMKPGERKWADIFSRNLIDKKYLLIVSSEQLNEYNPEKVPTRLTKNQKVLDVIFYKDGAPAFYIIESQKVEQI